jgi:hypothetical protein
LAVDFVFLGTRLEFGEEGYDCRDKSGGQDVVMGCCGGEKWKEYLSVGKCAKDWLKDE